MMPSMTNESPRMGGTYIADPKTGEPSLVPGSRTEPQPTQAELEAAQNTSIDLTKAPKPALEPSPKP
jgi:hypothetical protein